MNFGASSLSIDVIASKRCMSTRLQTASKRASSSRDRSRSPIRFSPRPLRDICKRPIIHTKMSPFGFFVMMCYEEYKKKHPACAVPIRELSKKCSQRWKKMSNKERRFYELAQEEAECDEVERILDEQRNTSEYQTALPPPPPVPAFELLEGVQDIKPRIEKLSLPTAIGAKIQGQQDVKKEPVEHGILDVDQLPSIASDLLEGAEDVKPQVDKLNPPTVSMIETRQLQFDSPTVSVVEVQQPRPLEPWMYSSSEPQSSTMSSLSNDSEMEEEESLESEAEESDVGESSDWFEAEEEAKEFERNERNENLKKWEKNMVQFSGGTLVPEYQVMKAAEFHWSSKRATGRSRQSTSHHFRFLRNSKDYVKLRKYYQQGSDKINRLERLKIIAHRLKDLIEEKRLAGIRLQDCDLQEMAMRINGNLIDPILDFKASSVWISRFKRKIGFSTRVKAKSTNKSSPTLSNITASPLRKAKSR